jgi:hypothetical protein
VLVDDAEIVLDDDDEAVLDDTALEVEVTVAALEEVCTLDIVAVEEAVEEYVLKDEREEIADSVATEEDVCLEE